MFSSDGRLIQRWLKGDKTAFDRLYDRHAGRVFHLLRRLSGSQSLAEDLTQETFLAAYRSLANWRGEGAFSTWLCGIAFRQYANQRRRLSACDTHELFGEVEILLPAVDPLEHCAGRESVERMERVISLL